VGNERDAWRKASQVSIHVVAPYSAIGDPAAVLCGYDYCVQCQVGRIGQHQHELPIWRGMKRYLDHSRVVSDVDADLGYLRPLPTQRVEECQGWRAATGGIHDQIGGEGLRMPRAVGKLNAARAR
jgi:hypothetical protein